MNQNQEDLMLKIKVAFSSMETETQKRNTLLRIS